MGGNGWIQASKKKLDEFFGYKDASVYWRANEAKIEPETAVNITSSLDYPQIINITKIVRANKKVNTSRSKGWTCLTSMGIGEKANASQYKERISGLWKADRASKGQNPKRFQERPMEWLVKCPVKTVIRVCRLEQADSYALGCRV